MMFVNHPLIKKHSATRNFTLTPFLYPQLHMETHGSSKQSLPIPVLNPLS